MAKYREKPIVIEAVQFTGDNEHEIADFMGISITELWTDVDAVLRTDGDYRENTHIHINTLEGMMTADCGDWIIKGVKGEFYPCKPDIFDETYEGVKRMKRDFDRIHAYPDYDSNIRIEAYRNDKMGEKEYCLIPVKYAKILAYEILETISEYEAKE